MKKLLLSLGVFASFAVTAQVDTLSGHFQSGPTYYTTSGGEYVAGTNEYDDKAKMQLFDAEYGVTGAGTITNVLVAVAVKEDAGGDIKVKLWENNAGAPGAELGSVTFPLSQIDTAIANYQFGLGFFYNVNATFSVAIPTNGSFWAGIELPAVGPDAVGLWTTDVGFADSTTHVGEFWSDDTFHSFGDPANWGLGVALAVFPVVNLQAGIAEEEMGAVVYPNPANDVLNFKLDVNASNFEVVTMDGKVVVSENVNSNIGSVNISDLESGMYMYVIKTENGSKATSTFVKK